MDQEFDPHTRIKDIAVLFIYFIDLPRTRGPYHKHNRIPQEHKNG